MRALRRAYGSGPLHFLAVAVCLVVSGYALVRIAGSAMPVAIGVWFLAALLAHDFVFYPAYTVLDRAAGRALGRRHTGRPSWANFVRVPVLITGLVFMIWFPLILGLNAKTYRDASGLGTNRFLGRFLVFAAVVFVCSAILYALRALLSARATVKHR